MPTRIKRYEERLDKLEQLLDRIDAEMGSKAQLETREFRRGGFLGLIGGLRMIEVVATTEVELNHQPLDKVKSSFVQPIDNLASSQIEEPAPVPIKTPDVTEDSSDSDNVAKSVSEGLAAISNAVDNGQRTIDIQADEPMSVPFESAETELPHTTPLQPSSNLEEASSTAQLDKPSPIDSPVPTEVDVRQDKPVETQADENDGVVADTVEQSKSTASTDDIAEIKSTISELTQTISMLVAQSQPVAPPADPVVETFPTSGNSINEHPQVNPIAIDPGTVFSGVQRNVFDRLLDWNIGPYDSIELINTALSAHDNPIELTEDSLSQLVIRDICRNVLLSGGIELRPGPPGKSVALIGATGIGKTTTIAKLAAHFAFQGGKRVSLVSLDNYRIAAAEQLRTYTEIMGIDLDIVFSKDEFDKVLTQRAHNDLVLIDTAGRSPFNTKQIFELRDIFSTHPPDEVHLVVSASTKGDDLRTIIENFEPLSYDHVIVSKLDETRSLGCIYNINKMCKKPISYFTVGQSVPEDIRTATLSFIQGWIEQGRIL